MGIIFLTTTLHVQVISLLVISGVHLAYLRLYAPFLRRVDQVSEMVSAAADVIIFVCVLVLVGKDGTSDQARCVLLPPKMRFGCTIEVHALVFQCLLHTPQFWPKVQTFAVLSAVRQANSNWGMCSKHCNTMESQSALCLDVFTSRASALMRRC